MKQDIITIGDNKNEDNLVECVCGNWAHRDYSREDTEGGFLCPMCTIGFMNLLVINLADLVREIADPELSEEDIKGMMKAKYSKITEVSVKDLEDMGYFDHIDII